MEMYGSLENVSYITLAPEISNAYQVIRELSSTGINVALGKYSPKMEYFSHYLSNTCILPGHSEANLSQGEKAVQNGATFITHLFNAMLPVKLIK